MDRLEEQIRSEQDDREWECEERDALWGLTPTTGPCRHAGERFAMDMKMDHDLEVSHIVTAIRYSCRRCGRKWTTELRRAERRVG